MSVIQGIPTQVPSCQKESKTQPAEAAVWGGAEEVAGTAPGRPGESGVLLLLPEGWGVRGRGHDISGLVPLSCTSVPPGERRGPGCWSRWVLRWAPAAHGLVQPRERPHQLPVGMQTPGAGVAPRPLSHAPGGLPCPLGFPSSGHWLSPRHF